MLLYVRKLVYYSSFIVLLALIVLLNASCGSKDSGEITIEKFELSTSNDYSTMHSRDERVFSVLAYPQGITEDDFEIETNWEEYISISDIKLENLDDSTEISFTVSIDPSLLKKSSDALADICLKATNGKAESDSISFSLLGAEIFDAEALTLEAGEPQMATFKVIPASLPLDELQIGMNAYVDNIDAKIIDTEVDQDNNCQYVHVEITAYGRYNNLAKSTVHLNDIYQFRGGKCPLTIND